jgi:hypothetical protein
LTPLRRTHPHITVAFFNDHRASRLPSLPKSPSLTLQAFSLNTLNPAPHTSTHPHTHKPTPCTSLLPISTITTLTMQNNQQKGIFHFIQFLVLFFITHVQLRQNGIAQIEETDTSSSSFSSSSSCTNDVITHNDDDELQALMVQLAQPKPRSCWVRSRCKDFILGVLRDQYLQGNEFADTFRMTRNSFEQLHALLSTTLFHPCFLLINRTLYYLTGHQLPSSNSIKDTSSRISAACCARHELSNNFKPFRYRARYSFSMCS